MNKIIIVYSIMHTGTWFTCSTLEKSEGNLLSRSDSWVRGHYKQRIEDIVSGSDTPYSFWSDKVKALPQVGWSLDNVDNLILQGHHQNNSYLQRSITKSKPEVPVVIPMRDPILSLHSKLWRAMEYHKAPIERPRRVKLCKQWIKLYKNLLSVPTENAFTLPIDTNLSKTDRVSCIKGLAEHCDMPFTKEMEKSALSWGQVNDTKSFIKKSQHKEPNPRWETFKRRYRSQDKKHTESVMDIEFKLLHEDTELQEMLYNIGYRNLLWWK